MTLRRTTTCLAIVLTLAFATRTYAFLGIGDIVFDPSVYAQAVEQVIRLERQYAQLVESYQMLRNQYEQMLWNARHVPVEMGVRYRALATPWASPRASDLYGTTGSWTRGATTGLDIAGAFAGATEPLRDYGAGMAGLSAEQQRYVKTSYGTVELTDGATQGAIETIGRLRANALAVQGTLERLEHDSLSLAPEMNTAVGVLNKINAATVFALRSAQDTNSLLVALAEQQAVAAKRTRDAEARAINQHVRFLTEARPLLEAETAGASDAMRTWRMP